jgi:two-component system nitrate/nitrite response regulator NarL
MGEHTATIIIEPRALVREALVSLMERNSYHVVCSVASMTDIHGAAFEELQPKLVILGVFPAERIAEAAGSIHRRWQEAKITVLYEKAPSRDLLNLLASGIDACIPMFASPGTLISAMQLIGDEQLRVLIVSDSESPASSIDPQEDDEDASRLEGRPRIASFIQPLSRFGIPGGRNVFAKAPLDGTAPGRAAHSLSEREDQILKALVEGHSNKVMARMFTLTEATVKVHMKSILRKIRVANRTQAAIWALQNEYCADVTETTPKRMQTARANEMRP